MQRQTFKNYTVFRAELATFNEHSLPEWFTPNLGPTLTGLAEESSASQYPVLGLPGSTPRNHNSLVLDTKHSSEHKAHQMRETAPNIMTGWMYVSQTTLHAVLTSCHAVSGAATTVSWALPQLHPWTWSWWPSQMPPAFSQPPNHLNFCHRLVPWPESWNQDFRHWLMARVKAQALL